jgi:hypothetical protein
MKNFTNALTSTLNKENVLTENGAIAYKTSGKALVDFNFKMSSYRNSSEKEIVNDFIKVFNEDKMLAIKMLFFTGDIREGMGERRVFNVCMNWIANNHPDIAIAVLPLIAEYNRWDSAINLCFNKETSKEATDFIANQLMNDIHNMNKNKSISLLAKWMPSINTSSFKTVKNGKKLTKLLKKSERDYRKTLSSLRNYLKVVEVDMSSNNWSEINYNHVPSKANLIYKNAFMKHDEQRRKDYLDKLVKGEAKINSSASFPYEIIHKYNSSYFHHTEDDTLESMWKALPNYVKENGSKTICVVDGSGSMCSNVGDTSVTAWEVATSLAIYFSEKMEGEFNNKYITFSRNPKLISFKPEWSLLEKLIECRCHTEVENTNIEKAFDLILQTAINNHLKQEDLPKNILILSDMEFDTNSIYIPHVNYNSYKFNSGLTTLFESLIQRFEEAGYKMPKLIFWNIISRTKNIPIQENEAGVALVSGFNPTIASMIFSEKLDPYEIIVEKLNSVRYESIETAIKHLI